MNWHESVGKHPDWMQVMTILAQSVSAYPHQRVEMWWHLSGKQLRWAECLSFVTQLEPLLKEGELVFQPRFYHLPENFQKHLLQFIYEHCDDISLITLRHFLQSLVEKCRSTKVDWIGLYLNLLQNRLICRQKEEELSGAEMKRREQKEEDLSGAKMKRREQKEEELSGAEMKRGEFQTSLTTEFNFSERNTSQLLNLCQRLRGASDSGSASNVAGLNSREIGGRKPSPPGSHSCQAEDFGEECIDLQQEVTVISLEKSVAVGDEADMESLVVDDREIPGCVIDSEIQMAVLKLRESWLNETQAVDPEVVLLLKDLSPKQLQIVLEQLDALNLPDASVLLAAQTLECASQQISYNNVMLFASVFLLPQILKREQAASRLFAAAVVSFVKAFPLHSIDGLLKPLLASSTSSCGITQSELVIKVIREALSNQHLQKLLHVLLDADGLMLSDQVLDVLQSIIDLKVELSSDHLKRLLSSLESNSLTNSANRKFGKLLMSFVQVYGHALTSTERRQCGQMADSHKTFLSKLIKSTLAKLSTD